MKNKPKFKLFDVVYYTGGESAEHEYGLDFNSNRPYIINRFKYAEIYNSGRFDFDTTGEWFVRVDGIDRFVPEKYFTNHRSAPTTPTEPLPKFKKLDVVYCGEDGIGLELNRPYVVDSCSLGVYCDYKPIVTTDGVGGAGGTGIVEWQIRIIGSDKYFPERFFTKDPPKKVDRYFKQLKDCTAHKWFWGISLHRQPNDCMFLPTEDVEKLYDWVMEKPSKLDKYKPFNECEWVFERSSGYAGYRNRRTGDWIYNEEYQKLTNGF